jgi:hypothetical protein
LCVGKLGEDFRSCMCGSPDYGQVQECRPAVAQETVLPFGGKDGDEADGEGVLGVRHALRALVEVGLI